MSEETIVAPAKRRGRPKKQVPEITVTPVRQVCQWCRTEVLAGQEPRIWVTCAKCQAIENAWLAETPCPYCEGRKAVSVAGVRLKNGHRDNCITNAEPATPRRKLTEEDVQQVLDRLGPAPVKL